jgi:cytochrome c peroxidase
MRRSAECPSAALSVIGSLLVLGLAAGCSGGRPGSNGDGSAPPGGDVAGGGAGDGAGAGGGDVGGGGGAVGGGEGVVSTTVTAIPTAPTGLPAIARSAGFNVVASPGMTPPSPSVAPVPPMTGGTIIDEDAAIRLGKALFWDAQAGSDGKIACASCHFHAGADSRTFQTTHPGGDLAFQTSDDAIGSSGVFSMSFGGISTDLSDPVDVCSSVTPGDPTQAVLFGAGQRLVTGRNAPTVLGAVFFLDNFYDGRASHSFNGLDPLGAGAAVAGNASLASQSLGPPLSGVEMSCTGRTWNGPNSLGAKLVPRTPLAKQVVAPDDSALGPLSNFPGPGLKCGFADRLCTYADLIAAAFGTGALAGPAAVDAYVNGFASIWGQAVQAYEATLVPDRTPYDLGLLTPAQVNGLNRFRGKCGSCHVEPEFSDATVRVITANGGPAVPHLVQPSDPLAAPQPADQGYHNIGVTPTAQDRGRKASPGGTYHTAAPGALDFNDGAFKTPGLRNLKLTAPYMHNGRIPTIDGVLDFYDGAGMVLNAEIDAEVLDAGVSDDFFADVRDFLANGLTDCRVEHELAPFDHPSLEIPNLPAPLPARGAAGDGTICP